MVHVPVLKKEVLEYLNVGPNKNFIDCTVGEGGHAAAVLEKNAPKGEILGIEIDSELYKKLKKRKLDRLILVNGSYTDLEEIVKKKNFEPVHGILFDLGMSSWHLEKSGRGFSFLRNEPLDMRYSTEFQDLTAAKIVNDWPKSEIEKVLRIYGEEKYWKQVAKKIVRERKKRSITTTFQLVELIKGVLPEGYEGGRIHPATRTFQALRIAVNNELKNLHRALPQALNILEPRGRLVVISFHSLEDRIVKFFLEREAKENLLKILTKKPVRPSEEELKRNPRSRSAKLRAACKIV